MKNSDNCCSRTRDAGRPGWLGKPLRRDTEYLGVCLADTSLQMILIREALIEARARNDSDDHPMGLPANSLKLWGVTSKLQKFNLSPRCKWTPSGTCPAIAAITDWRCTASSNIESIVGFVKELGSNLIPKRNLPYGQMSYIRSIR